MYVPLNLMYWVPVPTIQLKIRNIMIVNDFCSLEIKLLIFCREATKEKKNNMCINSVPPPQVILLRKA